MRISFLGDVMVTMEQLDPYKINDSYDFYPALKSISKEFETSDLIIANLETPIAGMSARYTHEQFSFNSPIELPKALKDAGVSIVATANNHCLDRKEEGLIQTINNLKSCGLESLGTHIKKEDSYIIKEIDGIKVGFLSFTYGTNAFANGNYLSKEHEYMVDLLQEQELSNPLIRKMYLSRFFPIRCMRAVARRLHIGQLDKPVYERRESAKEKIEYYKNTVKKCRSEGADYIAAYLHIGGQYNSQPTDYTKEICELSRELGINAIIANHEHVIHEIDWEYISETSFCIYSLGNFLSSSGVIREPYDKLAQYSVAVNIDLNKHNDGGIKAEYSFEIFCNRLDEKRRIISEPLIDYISQCDDEDLRQNLINDYNVLMNRICNTKQRNYPLQREYKLNYSGR